MQIKPQWDTISYMLEGMLFKKKKKQKITNTWKDVEKLELLHTAGGSVK